MLDRCHQAMGSTVTHETVTIAMWLVRDAMRYEHDVIFPAVNICTTRLVTIQGVSKISDRKICKCHRIR